MLEPFIEYDHGATVYRPAYNPEFVKRAREKRCKAEAERVAKEREALEAAARKLRAEQHEAIARSEMERLKNSSDRRFAEMIDRLDKRLGTPTAIAVVDIIAVVAAKHGVTVADIKSRSRSAPIVRARFEAIAEVRRLRPELSLPQIGRQFGKRDHTSIFHALRKMGMPTASAQGRINGGRPAYQRA